MSDSAKALVFLMPLTFASNIFVGMATMPSWLQAIVRHNPSHFPDERLARPHAPIPLRMYHQEA